MFEHEKYTQVHENAVITEFIKEMNRLNGPEWFVVFLTAADEIRYVEIIKEQNDEKRINLLSEMYFNTAKTIFENFRPIMVAFWRALTNIGVAEVTYTEEETRNMHIWLKMHQKKEDSVQ